MKTAEWLAVPRLTGRPMVPWFRACLFYRRVVIERLQISEASLLMAQQNTLRQTSAES